MHARAVGRPVSAPGSASASAALAGRSRLDPHTLSCCSATRALKPCLTCCARMRATGSCLPPTQLSTCRGLRQT